MASESQTGRSIVWTTEQEQGITTTGRDLLVSAAAGSGKTTILAERCAYLVCDARPPCDVDELLVVTFTDAAAAQMKSRIHAALLKRIGNSADLRLRAQLPLIDQAHVSTLHSFCARLLRQQFHLAELDPGFRVLSAEEGGLLRQEIARALFAKRHDALDADAFHRFIDLYGDGNEEPLLRRVISAHEMLCSLVEPNAWIATQRHQLEDAAARPLDQSALGQALLLQVGCGLKALRERANESRALIVSLKLFAGYITWIDNQLVTLGEWEEAFEAGGIDALSRIAGEYKPEKLPPVKSGVANKELAKETVDALREAFREGTWRDMLNFSTLDWHEGLQAIVPEAQTFLGLIEDFARDYRRSKDESRCVDFSDLERKTLKVLREPNSPAGELRPSSVARACHRRFKHVLVDEYQDINEVQDAILALVSHSATRRAERGEASNLFCVGDVKQSIYRFRLAEPAQFLNRLVELRGTGKTKQSGVIDLQANFRSRAPLLQAINGVFERLMTKEAADISYDASHRLVAQRTFPVATGCFSGAPIELHLLPARAFSAADPTADLEEASGEEDLDRSEREALLVVRRIRQFMGIDASEPDQKATRACVMEPAGGDAMRARPIRYGDIVVLLRSMAHKSEQFARILGSAGIPVHAGSVSGYFESPEIRDMLALLSLLNNQRQDVPMAAVLRSPFGKLPEPERSLARIRLAYPVAQEPVVPFHDAVVRYAATGGDELAARLKDFLDELHVWRQIARRRTPDELISEVYQQSGYLAFCAGLPGGEQRVANLLDLHERAAQFASFARPDLHRFLQFIQSLRDEADLGMPAVATEADDVVRIMSVHRAKGLEFPVVILPDLGKAINDRDCQGAILMDRRAGLGLSVVDDERKIRYPSLASTLVRARVRQQLMAEELRVLYVAMTRAKEHLIVVGTAPPGAMDKWRSTWRVHQGSLPVDAVLGARSMLHWLGPVAAATESADAPIFTTTDHLAEEVAQWKSPSQAREDVSQTQMDRAALRPIEPAPLVSDAALGAIERLGFRYPFEAFTHVPASQSVTGRAKHPDSPTRETFDELEYPAPAGAPSLAAVLERPRFLAGQVKLKPTELGDATHRILQHLNVAKAQSPADVDAQIEELVAKHICSALEAQQVDRPAILWFAKTELGQLMATHESAIRREIPVNFPAPSLEDGAGAELLDRIMIRGRLDALLVLPEGSIVIDYKTDVVSGAALLRRVEVYREQMRLYRQAIEQITSKPVVRVCLVFLSAQRIEDV